MQGPPSYDHAELRVRAFAYKTQNINHSEFIRRDELNSVYHHKLFDSHAGGHTVIIQTSI